MNQVGMCPTMCYGIDVLTLHARPSDDEVTMTRMLDKVLRRSDAVDKESLCVLAGQRVGARTLTRSYF